MGKNEDVANTLRNIVGSRYNSGDEDVFNYIVSVLEDDEDCTEATELEELVGPLLVGGGFADGEDEAHQLCTQLQQALKLNSKSNEAGDWVGGSVRALEGGPVTLGAQIQDDSQNFVNSKTKDVRVTNNEDFSLMTEKDAAKLKKQYEKAERAKKATLQAHQEAALGALAGEQVRIVRTNDGAPPVRDIHLSNVSVGNGGEELISDATITLTYRRRYGLVGRNGTGKTTFLRALATRQVPGLPENCQVLHVEQEVVGDAEVSVLDAVLSCDVERTELLEEEARLLALSENGVPENGVPQSNSERIQAVSQRLLEIDAFGAEARAREILAGLSFTQEMQNSPTSRLSGGWRMRVALARALFVQPDLLLLDEPTNHLDLHAVLWLQDHLLSWPSTLIVVSHARQFLNTVCTDTIHLANKKLTAYKGNYDVFHKTLAERRRCAQASAESVAAKKAHMQAFIDRFRYNANRAALVQSRIKALERLDDSVLADSEVLSTDAGQIEYQFRFADPPDAVPPPVISFNDVSFGYSDSKMLFKNLNFGLDCDTRAAVVGPNGIGKSTLLGLISGALTPTSGHIYRNPKVRLAVFSQHHVDNIDLALTPLTYMATCYPDAKEQQYRSHLASFGIGVDLAGQPMYTLSGGQKSRVALARVTWRKPHILLLDEPSNHLDIDAVDALAEGLALFRGGVLMVSHDQHLIEATMDELWAVEGGRLAVFHGTFEDYKRILQTGKRGG